MAWAVDSCLLIDVAAKDPRFRRFFSAITGRRRADALVICPISYVELSPLFNGQRLALEEFLHIVDVRWPEAWILADTYAAFDAWARYVAQKRQGKHSQTSDRRHVDWRVCIALPRIANSQ